MNSKRIEKLMKLLIGITAILIIAGAIFKLEHYPHGNLMLWVGFISSFTLSSFEIYRLRGIIKKLENRNN